MRLSHLFKNETSAASSASEKAALWRAGWMHYVDDAERPEQMSGLTSGTLPVWHVGGGTCLGMLTQHRTSNREREGGKNRGKYIKSQLEQWHKRETRLIYFRERQGLVSAVWCDRGDDRGQGKSFLFRWAPLANGSAVSAHHSPCYDNSYRVSIQAQMLRKSWILLQHRCSSTVFSDVFTDI